MKTCTIKKYESNFLRDRENHFLNEILREQMKMQKKISDENQNVQWMEYKETIIHRIDHSHDSCAKEN